MSKQTRRIGQEKEQTGYRLYITKVSYNMFTVYLSG